MGKSNRRQDMSSGGVSKSNPHPILVTLFPPCCLARTIGLLCGPDNKLIVLLSGSVARTSISSQ